MDELDLLTRAHRLFATEARRGAPMPSGLTDRTERLLRQAAGAEVGGGRQLYRLAVDAGRAELSAAGGADAVLQRVFAAAHDDHTLARERTESVLDAARADTAAADTPLARRELLRRRAARLRAQHGHVATARQRARRHRDTLRTLGYRSTRRHRRSARRLPPPNSRAGIAVRAALSRLGRPYVWGATGPGQFDCSGLTQWSYAQAGLHLERTTYQQIHDGIPVPRAQVRPGDLVFPSAGHVQLAIGDNRVIEAPHPGATVRISPLGANVVIRRPT